MSGMELRGGTKTVERDPIEVELLLLSTDRIVRMEPVGERVSCESDTETGRLTASL